MDIWHLQTLMQSPRSASELHGPVEFKIGSFPTVDSPGFLGSVGGHTTLQGCDAAPTCVSNEQPSTNLMETFAKLDSSGRTSPCLLSSTSKRGRSDDGYQTCEKVRPVRQLRSYR